VIVVYKVDRLTRSLTDFAKLVDVFDEHSVSFVSVIQAFNTTTSMGRLTLNVLLSFAQFEREVTAERIRDKFEASKKKGIWMGGPCPIGYQHEDRKLHIKEDEAKVVRTIYKLYLKEKNATQVKAALEAMSMRSKTRIDKSGAVKGGKPFSRGAIYWILKNPIYMGKIQHKDKIYDGNHDAIIAKEMWHRVQQVLGANTGDRARARNNKCLALLSGLLTDDKGSPLVPRLAKNRGKTYRYYVSKESQSDDQGPGWSIPAKTIEPLVKDILISTFSSKQDILSLLKVKSPLAEFVQRVERIGRAVVADIEKADHQQLKLFINGMLGSICVQADQITIAFKANFIEDKFGTSQPKDRKIELKKSMTLKKRGQELKMIIGGETQKTPNPDPALIKLIARAYALRSGLETGSIASIKDFADNQIIDHSDAKRLLPLGYLAPDIVDAILKGQQPHDLTATDLKNGYKLPTLWSEQRAKYGFPAK